METLLYYLNQTLDYKYLKIILTSFVSWITWLIGGYDVPIQTLLVLVTCDYILWFAYAWKTNNIKAKKMKEGVWKYLLYTIAIIMGNMLDLSIFKYSPEFGWHSLIVIYLCVNEAISISKHLANFNVKLPIKLIAKLESYRDEFDLPERREKRINEIVKK